MKSQLRTYCISGLHQDSKIDGYLCLDFHKKHQYEQQIHHCTTIPCQMHAKYAHDGSTVASGCETHHIRY